MEHKKLIDDRQQLFLARDEVVEWHKLSNFEDTPEFIERTIMKSKALSQEERDAIKLKFGDEIEDVKYYCKHHKFRRIDHWLSGNEQ